MHCARCLEFLYFFLVVDLVLHQARSNHFDCTALRQIIATFCTNQFIEHFFDSICEKKLTGCNLPSQNEFLKALFQPEKQLLTKCTIQLQFGCICSYGLLQKQGSYDKVPP
jgi:hypothetical protein